MAILPDESHRAVVEDGHDHGAAIVMDHFALIGQLTFAHGIDSDADDTTFEDFLTAQIFGNSRCGVLILFSY